VQDDFYQIGTKPSFWVKKREIQKHSLEEKEYFYFF